MKVTVLIENTSHGNLKCEHGLSLLIQQEDRKILLDAGSSEQFSENAKALHISFDDLNACVLSHGHYDHSGGFEAVFRENARVKVYARKSVVENYYSGSGGLHEIGVPENVLAHGDRFVFVDGVQEIFPGVYLVPHSLPGLDKIGEKSKLYKKVKGEIVPDDFSHEQSLVFDTEKGLIVFNSCSHGGVKKIIREVKMTCGDKPICAYVGGLHMKGKRGGEEICAFSEEEVDDLCGAIREAEITQVYTGHCTGLPGLEKLRERLGASVHSLSTGMRFEI